MEAAKDKDSLAQAYAVDRALKKHDAAKRLLPSRRAAWEVREYNRARNERLQRDKVPLRDAADDVDDDYDVDVQRELLDEWAQRARDRREGSPVRPSVELPVEQFVVGTMKSRAIPPEGYELVVDGRNGVIALDEKSSIAPEPHEEWEHVEKDVDDRPGQVLSYAATVRR
ncbi:hypothetical protein AURDEDRAFT_116029, partial [Auricularia subglabra TFB-10046 SS5]